MNKPRFQVDIQGLIRTAITIGTIVAAYYIDRAQMSDKISGMRSEFQAHCASSKMYSMAELQERFVLRREWERGHDDMRAELRYLRSKVDVINDKIDKINFRSEK